jgi:DNA-binding transcriptional ArsR family regulator
VTELDAAAVAGLFADRSRVAMIDLLLDGQDHALAALAGAARIAPSTAIGHVSLLERGGIVVSRRRGRNRLVRLAGPEVAAAYEALAELAPEGRVTSLRASTRRAQLAAARTCYDHLAGRLGVALTDAALEADALTADFGLGPSAPAWFGRLGVDLDALPRGRRPFIRVCIDWTERREHLAGSLGAAVCSALLDGGWVARTPATRALTVTPRGGAELAAIGVR